MKLMKVLLVMVALVLLGPSAPALAGEEATAKEDEKKEETGSKTRVYTNRDLKKYHGKTGKPGKARVVVDTMATPAAPAGSLTPEEKQQKLVELRKELAEAQARIAELDRRERSVVNPFLPRPELSQEEKEAEAGMDSRQIQQKIRGERQELRRRISDLTAELTRVSAIPTRPRPESAKAGLEAPKPAP